MGLKKRRERERKKNTPEVNLFRTYNQNFFDLLVNGLTLVPKGLN